MSAGTFISTGTANVALVSTAAAQASDEPIYYQDPDGRPLYSLTPKKTPDGRDYRAVPAERRSQLRRRTGRRARNRGRDGPQDKILPQPDGAARHLADPEEGFDGDGLHPGL